MENLAARFLNDVQIPEVICLLCSGLLSCVIDMLRFPISPYSVASVYDLITLVSDFLFLLADHLTSRLLVLYRLGHSMDFNLQWRIFILVESLKSVVFSIYNA